MLAYLTHECPRLQLNNLSNRLDGAFLHRSCRRRMELWVFHCRFSKRMRTLSCLLSRFKIDQTELDQRCANLSRSSPRESKHSAVGRDDAR
jgi:hypothetical protein